MKQSGRQTQECCAFLNRVKREKKKSFLAQCVVKYNFCRCGEGRDGLFVCFENREKPWMLRPVCRSIKKQQQRKTLDSTEWESDDETAPSGLKGLRCITVQGDVRRRYYAALHACHALIHPSIQHKRLDVGGSAAPRTTVITTDTSDWLRTTAFPNFL